MLKILKVFTKTLVKTRKICENGNFFHNLMLRVIVHQKSMKKAKKGFRLWWDLNQGSQSSVKYTF